MKSQKPESNNQHFKNSNRLSVATTKQQTKSRTENFGNGQKSKSTEQEAQQRPPNLRTQRRDKREAISPKHEISLRHEGYIYILDVCTQTTHGMYFNGLHPEYGGGLMIAWDALRAGMRVHQSGLCARGCECNYGANIQCVCAGRGCRVKGRYFAVWLVFWDGLIFFNFDWGFYKMLIIFFIWMGLIL